MSKDVLSIHNHNFNDALNRLGELSKQTPRTPEIANLKEKTFFFFDHRVTGQELNERLSMVRNGFITLSNALTHYANEFREIYQLFDCLDGDYISGILKAQETADDSIEKIKVAQQDIVETQQVQEETLSLLLKFKSDIEILDPCKQADWARKHIEETATDIKNVQKDHQDIVYTVSRLENTLNNLYSRLYALEPEKQLASIRKELETLNQSIITFRTETTALQTQVRDAANERKILREDVDAAQKDLSALMDTQLEMSQKLDSFGIQQSEVEARMVKAGKGASRMEKDLDTLFGQIERIRTLMNTSQLPQVVRYNEDYPELSGEIWPEFDNNTSWWIRSQRMFHRIANGIGVAFRNGIAEMKPRRNEDRSSVDKRK